MIGRMRVESISVLSHCSDVRKRLHQRPTTVEELVEMKQYMSTVEAQVQELATRGRHVEVCCLCD